MSQTADGDLNGALNIARSINDDFARAATLAQIASLSLLNEDLSAVDSLIGEARTLAHHLTDPLSKATVFVNIAVAQAHTANRAELGADESSRRNNQAAKALDQALSVASQKVVESGKRDRVLARVVAVYAQWGHLLRAAQIAGSLEASRRASALEAIAVAQAKAGYADTALSTIQGISDETNRAVAVQKVARSLGAVQHTDVTMNWVRTQPSSLVKAHALLGLSQRALRFTELAASTASK